MKIFKVETVEKVLETCPKGLQTLKGGKKPEACHPERKRRISSDESSPVPPRGWPRGDSPGVELENFEIPYNENEILHPPRRVQNDSKFAKFGLFQWCQVSNKSGQILVIIPILMVFLIGAILMHINIAIMSQNRIRLQRSADTAARNGAMALTTIYKTIQITNTGLAAAYIAMTPPCCEPRGKTCTPLPTLCVCRKASARSKYPTCCGIWRAAHETAKGLIYAQKIAIDSIPAVVITAVGLSSDFSHKLYCAPMNYPKPNFKRAFAVPPSRDRKKQPMCTKCFDLNRPCGFTLRESADGGENCKVPERVNVIAYRPAEDAYGRAILGNLSFPRMFAWSSARPYYAKKDLNPRSDYLEGKNARFCMFSGPWDAKIIQFSFKNK